MLNREFIFSNPKIIKWLNENCVSVVGDDWYRRRAKDDASKWFRDIARKAGRGENGSTQQGSYLVTAHGDLLTFVNTSEPSKFIKIMLEGKKRWSQLSPNKRTATISPMKNHDYKTNVPPIDPKKDLVIEVQSRALEEKGGQLSQWDSKGKVGSRATLGHLWIKQSEWTSLVKELNHLKNFEHLEFPKFLTHRIARYHLIDNTRGEGPAWKNSEIKKAELEFIKDDGGFKIRGNFHLETTDSNRSFKGSLQGRLVLEKGKSLRPKIWTITAYGNHSGEARFTRNARPGAQPLAFTFEFLPEPMPLDLIPPQHMRWQKGYWEADKH